MGKLFVEKESESRPAPRSALCLLPASACTKLHVEICQPDFWRVLFEGPFLWLARVWFGMRGEGPLASEFTRPRESRRLHARAIGTVVELAREEELRISGMRLA
ncbi:hypothetical protein THAOC_30363 [Thalassiosira oceanica]|uniref:Uncharacterized protein n=1 Tax=Thalassiosira oceanica TaxID=159749 RepID=K0RAC4_THAOC|nr:hypothetical protein THAOC_30363 [Thalassiosira oceanica]|eukprot:EJK50603.1 hypothetical protein THAOC_30363 [Thalassiosira oceanica]